jgi:hypothetical protein
MALGELGVKTVVIDMHPSPGQGENKHAIGGIKNFTAKPSNGSRAAMPFRFTAKKMKRCSSGCCLSRRNTG